MLARRSTHLSLRSLISDSYFLVLSQPITTIYRFSSTARCTSSLHLLSNNVQLHTISRESPSFSLQLHSHYQGNSTPTPTHRVRSQRYTLYSFAYTTQNFNLVRYLRTHKRYNMNAYYYRLRNTNLTPVYAKSLRAAFNELKKIYHNYDISPWTTKLVRVAHGVKVPITSPGAKAYCPDCNKSFGMDKVRCTHCNPETWKQFRKPEERNKVFLPLSLTG